MSESGKPPKYTVKSVFYDVQFISHNNSTCMKILTDIFNKSDVNEFICEFVNCVKICLVHAEKSRNVELTLDFAAAFAVSFSLELKEDDTCPLLEGVFQFIFEHHDSQIPLVRLRICQLMNRLLDNMGHDASVVEETYNKIAESMLVRLKDSMSSVRTQAVYALHRLQSPTDPDCGIIPAFKYHMMHDPCHEVRRAVIQKIAVTKTALASVLTRVFDIKDTVRKEAYVFINRLVIRQFTIKQRQTILENGLDDRSDMVKEYVIRSLIPNWLKYFNFNFYEFLECIHVEKIPEAGLRILKAIFEKQDDIILQSKIKAMWIVNQEISYDKLNIITAVYWRALAEYMKPSTTSDKFDHIFEQILPDLTPFCNYIRGYFYRKASASEDISDVKDAEVSQDAPSTESSQSTASTSSPSKRKSDRGVKNRSENEPDEAVLVHLLNMCKVYDFSDEMGRNAVQKLCIDLLENTCVKQKNTVAELAILLDEVVPCTDTKLNIMAEVITELREPLLADACEPISDLLLLEAEEKKAEITMKLKDLEAEMEIVEELNDKERVEEINVLKKELNEELKTLHKETQLEPGRNVNNDPETLKKCLTIVVEIMKRGKITKMNATLYSLMENFVAPTLSQRIEGDQSAIIKNLALQALGIFCALDPGLAKEHFMMFCFYIANETLSVTALKCVFDLLYIYGLAYFNIEDPDSDSFKSNLDEDGNSKPNLIILLMSLLSSDSSESRKTAVIGLCKMLFAGKLKSADLVSKLIILWYNPEAESDPYIRQPLGTFFSMFATTCKHAPKLIQLAFIPTLKKLFHLEVTDPMAEVDVINVANLMVEFTKPNFNQHMTKEHSIHNQIAINICEEILTESYQSGHCVILIKIICSLELDYNLETDINIVKGLVSRISKIIEKEDKILYRLVFKLKLMLDERHENNKTVSTIDNTLPPEISLGSNVISHTSQLLESTTRSDGSDVEDEEAEEDENADLSQDMTSLMQSVDSLVIPGTPETSDDESVDVFKEVGPSASKSSKVQDSDFKLPRAPPAKTPFKKPTTSKTPRKTTSKTPTKNSEKERVKTPRKTRTPAKQTSEATITTPSRTRSSKKLSKSPPSSPSKTPSRDSSVSRSTRSAKKGKS